MGDELMNARALAVVCKGSSLTETLQASIDYYALIEEGAVQARHGATGIGRLWSETEQAAAHAQLGRLLGVEPCALVEEEP
jgi:hypothetical protein